jgi:arylsulfatase A-like enzyme
LNVLISTAVCATALAGPRGLPAGEVEKTRPNIVYIICDDLGYGDVQCLNPQRGKIKTPSIDHLASQGLTFTDAHGGSSVCTPTRYGVLTGRYAWRSRLQSGVLNGNAPPLIAEGRLTVGELLHRNGYRTAAIGKWHVGFQYDRSVAGKEDGQEDAPGKAETGKAAIPVGTRVIGGPVTRGFETYFGFHHAREMSALVENDRVIEDLEPIEMLPRLTKRAVEYIGEHAAEAKNGKPFFLYLAWNSPHTPIVPSKEWRGKSGLGDYGDFVMQTDAATGEVLAALDKAGIADNTLVFFTSDNGCSPAAGIEKLQKEGHFPSAQYRGHKADIWDGGHRIPFIARWPGHIQSGTKTDQLVCLTDLMATCAALVDVKFPDHAGEDSVNLLPVLLGKADAPVRDAIVHHSISGKFSIRQGPWKFELCSGSGGWSKGGDGEPVQLYDMVADPGEQKNLHKEKPEIVEQLTALLEKYVTEGRSTPGAPQKNDVAVNFEKGGKPGKDGGGKGKKKGGG